MPLVIPAATPEQIRDRVGIYLWGQMPGLDAVIMDVQSLGADRVVRAFIGPWSDIAPYEDDLRPLATKARSGEYQRLFGEFPVIMITAYDSHSYAAIYRDRTPDSLRISSDMVTSPNPLKVRAPSFGVVEALAGMSPESSTKFLQAVRQEFAEFAFELAHHDRTFILSNWEAENDVPDPAFWPWFADYLRARTDGIREGRARGRDQGLPARIFTAFEFTILPGFPGRRSALVDIASATGPIDYLSYSSWWSIGFDYDGATMGESFRTALRQIQGFIDTEGPTAEIIIGEFGEYWNEHPGGERLRAIVDVSLEEGAAYLFNWVLYDQPGEIDDHGRDASHFGKYRLDRTITPQGRALRQWYAEAGDRVPIGTAATASE